MNELTEFDKILDRDVDSVLQGRSFGALEGQSFVYYGTDGQAARQAAPSEQPELQPEVGSEEETRPMPSAGIFEALERTPRRRPQAGLLRTAGYVVAICILFAGLYVITGLSGKLNDLQVQNYRLRYTLSSLQSEEQLLEHQLVDKMSEAEMEAYARDVLEMVPAEKSETASGTVDFSTGDTFAVSGQGSDADDTIFTAAVAYVKNIISGVIDYIN